MDNKLLEKYLQYANTEEALAVLFVKKHLSQAKAHWIDIVYCRHHGASSRNLQFRIVMGALYQRRIQPKYPPTSDYTVDGIFDERAFYMMARAITWETAHTDIEQQKAKNVLASKFNITGEIYDKNLSYRKFFRDDAPPEIKALANNLNDRTNPLWDIALQYERKPEFVYKIDKIQLTQGGA